MLPIPNNSTIVYDSYLVQESNWNFEKKTVVSRVLGICYYHEELLSYNYNSEEAKFKALYILSFKIPDFITNFLIGKVIDDQFTLTFESFKLAKVDNKRELHVIVHHKSKTDSYFDFRAEGKLNTDIFDTNEFIQQNQVNPCVTKLLKE
jgi:hypothetical protein